ncbi:YybS family protein [Clostridium sp. LBM24168]
MQNKNYNVRAVVEAGLITAFIVVLMLICIYIPVFSIFTNFVLPIPIAVLYIKQNYKVTLISIIVSAILISILYNPITAISSISLVGLSGITFGYCIKNKKNFTTTILLTSLAIFIGMVIFLAVYIAIMSNGGIYSFISDSITKIIINPLKESIKINKEIYIKMKLSIDQLSYMENLISSITPEYIMRIIPAFILINSVFTAYLNYLIGNSILKKLNFDIVHIKPFNNIYMSTRIGTAAVLMLVVGLILNRNNMELAHYFINSSGIVLQFIFIVDGLALSAYYLKRKTNISNTLIAIILIVTIFIGLYFIYIVLGFIDMIIDFRKLDPYRIKKNNK